MCMSTHLQVTNIQEEGNDSKNLKKIEIDVENDDNNGSHGKEAVDDIFEKYSNNIDSNIDSFNMDSESDVLDKENAIKNFLRGKINYQKKYPQYYGGRDMKKEDENGVKGNQIVKKSKKEKKVKKTKKSKKAKKSKKKSKIDHNKEGLETPQNLDQIPSPNNPIVVDVELEEEINQEYIKITDITEEVKLPIFKYIHEVYEEPYIDQSEEDLPEQEDPKVNKIPVLQPQQSMKQFEDGEFNLSGINLKSKNTISEDTKQIKPPVAVPVIVPDPINDIPQKEQTPSTPPILKDFIPQFITPLLDIGDESLGIEENGNKSGAEDNGQSLITPNLKPAEITSNSNIVPIQI